MEYSAIAIFSSEDARWEGKPLPDAVLQLVKDSGLAARCLVTRGVAGLYEDGAMATQRVEVLSYNLPVKIEIILPAPEVEGLLPRLSEMVGEGLVGVSSLRVVSHRVRHRLVPRHLKVRDVMTPDPQSARPDWSLGQVLDTLLNADFTGLPVVDGRGRPVGIITDGDLVYRAGIPIRVRLLAEFPAGEISALKASLAAKQAQDIMSSPVLSVGQDQYLLEAVELMNKRGLRRLPVVEASGALAGMLSRVDIFQAIGQGAHTARALRQSGVVLDAPERVGEVMRRDTPAVAPETPLEQVIALLGNSAVERVAVVDGQGRLLGLISDHAMLSAFTEQREGLLGFLLRKMSLSDPEGRHAELIRRYQSTKAGQVMETGFPSLGPEASIEEAAALMTAQKIKRLPVLDDQGRLLGMLRRETLLRLGARPAAPGGIRAQA